MRMGQSGRKKSQNSEPGMAVALSRMPPEFLATTKKCLKRQVKPPHDTMAPAVVAAINARQGRRGELLLKVTGCGNKPQRP